LIAGVSTLLPDAVANPAVVPLLLLLPPQPPAKTTITTIPTPRIREVYTAGGGAPWPDRNSDEGLMAFSIRHADPSVVGRPTRCWISHQAAIRPWPGRNPSARAGSDRDVMGAAGPVSQDVWICASGANVPSWCTCCFRVPIIIMMPSRHAAGLIAVLGLALGCSSSASNASPDGAGGGSGPDGAGGGSGMDGGPLFIANRGCQSGGDCTGGETCARFGASGPGACVKPTAQATSCAGSNPRNQCCATSDCTAGSCFSVATQPVQCSSTAGVDVFNQCVADACASDTDCAGGQLCTPAGYGLARACIAAGCRSDADCSAETGGACVLLELGCCTPQIGGNIFRSTQLACAYPSNGCQKDADCPGAFCTISSGRASCSTSCR
jgi:hypothetical protein